MFTLKNYLNIPSALLLLASAVSLSSCDNGVIYEDLPPCDEARYFVKFQWNNNLFQADAFNRNVSSVAVYIFDENDVLMYYDTELGTTLYTQQNSLEIRGLDAPAGTYACLAWCGLENPGETRANSFEVPEVEIGKTTRQEIICMMKRDIYDDQTHHSSEELTDLYHGTTYVTIYDPSDEQFKGVHDYSLNLTKDTNNIRIMINQDGKMVDMDNFEVTIMDNNGTLKPDNEVDESDEQITYHPYEIGETNPAQEMRYRNLMTRASILPTASGAASLKISRLMNNHDVRLSVKSKTGNGELNVNLVENALRSKDFDLRNHNLSSAISNQQYLDFQDTYVLHFFFQSGVDLSNAVINVNGYTVYDQSVDMGN